MHTTGWRSLPALVALAVTLTACQDDPVRPSVAADRPATATSAPNEGATNPARRLTRWAEVSDADLWTQVQRAGSYAEIGLKLPHQRHGMAGGTVLVSAAQRAMGKRAVAAVGGVTVQSADTLLPLARVKLASLAALSALRRHPNVSFVEPGSFVDAERESLWMSPQSGCSVGPYAGPSGSTIISPGDVLPWTYSYMNIPAAWARVPGGFGVTVGIVDTGLDSYQPELNAGFATGMSAGRTFTKDATDYAAWPVIWQDDCGHGTRLASVIAGPRNGQSILGVAWGANLFTVRVDNDVLLTNVGATREGIRAAAQQAKIVAMAFGTPASYQSISDEIAYWYSLDRLFVAAAGTSTCWDPLRGVVTFPGSEPTVTTVTAFDKTGAIACNAHYGPSVDFAAFADQPVTGMSSLGSSLAGFAGSSNAVGIISGLAALSLSMHPAYTRDQIIGDLAYAASPNGARSSTSGWGSPDALCVVNGLCSAWINGTDLIQTYGTRTYSWTAGQAAVPPGSVSYQWSTGEVTRTISRRVTVSAGMEEYTLALRVTVRDNTDGSTRIVTKNVLVRDPYNCPTCW